MVVNKKCRKTPLFDDFLHPQKWRAAQRTVRNRLLPRLAREPQPRIAASIVAMSIFFIVIIASNARLAMARSGLVYA
jgi:hypothetical protein